MDPVIPRCLIACALLVGCSGDHEADKPEPSAEWPEALAPPNERSLAFVDHRMELSGGGETVVLEDLLNVNEATSADPAYAAWSTDGRFVAYVRSSFWSAADPETIVPEGATLVIVDTLTGDRIERTANTHDSLIFSGDVLVVSTDDGLVTLDPESGEPGDVVWHGNRVGQLRGVTSAGLVTVSLDGSLLRPTEPWSITVLLVQLNGSSQRLMSIDHGGAQVENVAYDPVTMTFALAVQVRPPGATNLSMCERDGRVSTVPLGSSTPTDLVLPAAPEGRRWHATSVRYRLDGTLVVRLVDYPLDCDTGDWTGDEHWYQLRDGQFVPITESVDIEEVSGERFPHWLSAPLVWTSEHRHRASLNAEDSAWPPNTTASDPVERQLAELFSAWLAGDEATVRAMATEEAIKALGDPSGDRFDVLWDHACLMGSSGAGGCNVLVLADDGPTIYTLLYTETQDGIRIDSIGSTQPGHTE